MADNKTKPTKLSVAALIGALTDQTRRTDAKMLVKLMQKASGREGADVGPIDHRLRHPPLEVRQWT
jgi:hypothetical protein